MFTYKKENQLPIKSWIPEENYYADEKMVEQVENLAKLPFAFHHISLSPDGHVGFGMPIGGVLATKDVIIPNAVGVDIGCGMCAVKTSLTEIDKETLKKIMGEIREAIPVGFNKHQSKQDESLMPKIIAFNSIDEEIYDNALRSLGTLGGGNHFIEIQKGSDGHIWIMIHSGSRNLGKQVADYYNKVAIELNKKWFSETQKELNFLPVDSEEGQSYIREMNYCVAFALANRKLMMDRIKDIFRTETENDWMPNDNGLIPTDPLFEPIINIAHNYASLENHYGENVWVHRKGATLARKGTIGIIPGSQGSKSYIVEGLGNPESFESCSHGAGRTMSRKKAREEINLKESQKRMEDKGILHAVRSKNDLDEAPEAYKNIDIVMENQKDLVEIKVELKPLAVIKG
jgi:tRNA-splicing ligase RtcB